MSAPGHWGPSSPGPPQGGHPGWQGHAPPPALEPQQQAAPQGPPPPPPRPVPWSAAGWNARFFVMFGFFFGGIPTLIFVLIGMSSGMPWDDWILNDRGKRAEATPYKVKATNTSINDQTLFDIRVKFEDHKGKRRKATVSTLDPALIASSRQGEPFDIEYDPENYKRVRVRGGDASPMGGLIFMPLLFGGIGIPMFLWGLITTLRQRSLYKRGTAAQARVQEVTMSSSSQNKQRLMIAHYSFHAPSGTQRGTWKTLNPPPVGGVIWIIYDPSRPNRSIAVVN